MLTPEQLDAIREAHEKPAGDPYFIERSGGGCSTCGHGRMWDVINPDGSARGTSYEEEDDAAELAEELNDAFDRGRQSSDIPALLQHIEEQTAEIDQLKVSAKDAQDAADAWMRIAARDADAARATDRNPTMDVLHQQISDLRARLETAERERDELRDAEESALELLGRIEALLDNAGIPTSGKRGGRKKSVPYWGAVERVRYVFQRLSALERVEEAAGDYILRLRQAHYAGKPEVRIKAEDELNDYGSAYTLALSALQPAKSPACPAYGPCESCGRPTDHGGECANCGEFGGTDKIVPPTSAHDCTEQALTAFDVPQLFRDKTDEYDSRIANPAVVDYDAMIREAVNQRTRDCFRQVASHASPASASWIKSAYPEAFAGAEAAKKRVEEARVRLRAEGRIYAESAPGFDAAPVVERKDDV